MKNDILEKEVLGDNVIKYIATVNNSSIKINWSDDDIHGQRMSIPFIYVLNRVDHEVMTNYKLSFTKQNEVNIDFGEPVEEGVSVLLMF